MTRTISGIVLDVNNQPIPGVQVSAISLNGDTFGHAGFTGTDGRYIIRGLSTGDYLVQAFGKRMNFINEYYDNVIRLIKRYLLSTQPSDTSDINFQLVVGGAISGIVLDDDNQPIPVVRMCLLCLWEGVSLKALV